MFATEAQKHGIAFLCVAALPWQDKIPEGKWDHDIVYG